MNKSNHVHKFKKHVYKTGNKVYFCALPDCLFKIAVELSLGKRCVCWRCGETFIMTSYSLRLSEPHCSACHKMKPGTKVKDNPVMPVTAQDTVTSLSSRLNSLTVSTPERTEDDEV